MRAEDIPRLHAILKTLAEAHDHKPVSEAGLEQWFEALQPFPIHKIEAHSKHWINTHSKFPAISDFFVPLNEAAVDEREASWTATKAREKNEAEQFQRTAQGSKALGMLKTAFTQRQKPHPKHWAEDILDAWADHKPLTYTHPITGGKYELDYETSVTTSTGQKEIVRVQSIPQPYSVRLACEALGIDYKALMSVPGKRWRECLTAPKATAPTQELETEGMREPGEE